ncbi:hypothetical protein ACIQ9P_03740 [Kitasatospora sp. NPDC094019]|uniref:hypothetical protein n=1 Tax=Kitasatospora sp. NPDC094019 TaxID=3364091 RepID=UPI0037F71B84
MSLAPPPDHNRTADPGWKALFDVYEPLITPLRRRGLVVDIDDRSGITIYAKLPDSTHLTIGTGTDDGHLPAAFDSVTSWVVIRESNDNPTLQHEIYNSTPDPDSHCGRAGSLLAPLLLAIDAALATWGMPGRPENHHAVVTVTTVHEADPAGFATSPVFPTGVIAASYHTDIVASLASDGLTVAHETGAAPWRAHVLVRGDHVQIVQTTLAELVPGHRTAPVPCFCRFAHPQTPQEDQQMHAEVQEALSLRDAHGVYVGMFRLLTAPNCPARKAADRA